MSSNSQTKFERLGNIFGAPLPKLDPEFLPKKTDVIRHWMSLFDDAKTSRILSPAKVPFIYYVSMDFFVKTKEFLFQHYILTKFSCCSLKLLVHKEKCSKNS
jgi:hypothetical protein